MHGPNHPSEECKVLKVYSEKYAAQRSHKYTEARSGGKPKHGEFAEFDRKTREASVIENYDIPIPRKKKVTKGAIKKRKIKSVKADAAEKGRTYGIGILNLADTVHAENYSVRGEENINENDSE